MRERFRRVVGCAVGSERRWHDTLRSRARALLCWIMFTACAVVYDGLLANLDSDLFVTCDLAQDILLPCSFIFLLLQKWFRVDWHNILYVTCVQVELSRLLYSVFAGGWTYKLLLCTLLKANVTESFLKATVTES